MNMRSMLLIGACVFCLVALLAPPSSAALQGTTARNSAVEVPANLRTDNPDVIAALKAQVAYVSALETDRMDGVIRYIGQISNGAGTAGLVSLESRFCALAASVPSMSSAGAIQGAREQMQENVKTFGEEAKSATKTYNGSVKDLRASVNASVTADASRLQGLKAAAWKAREHARLEVFDAFDRKRDELLANLTAKGIDVSAARAIDQQIGGMRTSLQQAFSGYDEQALRTLNGELKDLNTQFLATVKGYREQAKGQNRKNTTAMATPKKPATRK